MIPNIYQGNYKLLIIAPLILIFLSLFFMQSIKPGVDFRGGTLIKLTLSEKTDAKQLQLNLENEGLKSTVVTYNLPIGQVAEIELDQDENLIKAESLRDKFSRAFDDAVKKESSINSTNTALDKTQLNSLANQMFTLSKVEKNAQDISGLSALNKEFIVAYSKTYQNYQDSVSVPIQKYAKYSSISIHTVSPLLRGKFIEKAQQAVLYSAVVSILFVFIFFRTFVPSLAVVMGAASDIIIALGGMGLFGIPFTLPTLAALLMLMGFSLDTDILLTMRILKRSGTAREKAFDAFKTGTTMSIAAIVAFSVLLIVSFYTHISTYYEIAAVALIGLVGDLFATWGINAVLLLHHVESRDAKARGIN